MTTTITAENTTLIGTTPSTTGQMTLRVTEASDIGWGNEIPEMLRTNLNDGNPFRFLTAERSADDSEVTAWIYVQRCGGDHTQLTVFND